MVMLSCLPWSRSFDLLVICQDPAAGPQNTDAPFVRPPRCRHSPHQMTSWLPIQLNQIAFQVERWKCAMTSRCWTVELPNIFQKHDWPKYAFEYGLSPGNQVFHMSMVTMVIWMWSSPGLSCCRRQPWVMLGHGPFFFWGSYKVDSNAVAILNVPWRPWSPIWIDKQQIGSL